MRFRPLREGSASGTYTRRSTQAQSEETVMAFPEAWSVREITKVYVPPLPPGSMNGLTLPGSGAIPTSDRARVDLVAGGVTTTACSHQQRVMTA
jgi:hypothetical protein